MVNRAIRFLLFTFFVGFSNLCFGLTQAPQILRACLNTGDSTVTIEYKNPLDACGSFSEHHVYGKEVGPGFALMYVEASWATNSIQFKLPNANPTWTFFFQTLYLCNGTDSVKSNTLTIDTQKPTISEIDSVSIDLSTQKLIIGWSANSAADVAGYRIYKNVNSVNSTIGDTSTLSYFLPDHPVDQVIAVALAAFDSCNLFSPISNSHQAMILNHTYDPCSQDLTLSWSTYVGWNTEFLQAYASLNGSAYNKIATNLQSTNYTFKLKPGDSVCAFVRAYKLGDNATSSSSNRVCFKANDVKLPDDLYLSYASVLNEEVVEIEIHVNNNSNSDSLVLYQVDGPNLVLVGFSKINTNGTTTFNVASSRNTSQNSWRYVAKTFDPCIGESAISNTGQTMLLNLNSNQLSWNPYTEWEQGVDVYTVQGFDGSTWNNIGTSANFSYSLADEEHTCFRIEATEVSNSYGWSSKSYSNQVCLLKEPTFYVPNALNAAGINNTFRVIGTSIDLDKSTFIIFDRWGGHIAESNQVDVGWSISAEGNDIQPGVFFYVLSIVDLSGNKHKSKGSFRVIR